MYIYIYIYNKYYSTTVYKYDILYIIHIYIYIRLYFIVYLVGIMLVSVKPVHDHVSSKPVYDVTDEAGASRFSTR